MVKRFPVVRVTYLDSALMNGQTDELVVPCVITAVGFLVHKCKTHMVLSRELIRDEYRGQVAIPRCAISKMSKQ